MIPLAVMASELAMSTIVRFAVRTFGSRLICTPFETSLDVRVRVATQ